MFLFTHIARRYHLLGVLGLLLMLNACSVLKEPNSPEPIQNEFSVQQAKDWFDKNIVGSGASMRTTNDKLLSYRRDWKNKKLEWDYAYKSAGTDWDIIEVPLSYEHPTMSIYDTDKILGESNPTFVVEKDSSGSYGLNKYQTTISLVVARHSSGIIRSSIIEIIADESYKRINPERILDNRFSGLEKDFSGLVVYYSWDEVLTGLQVYKGGEQQYLPDLKNGRIQDWVCTGVLVPFNPHCFGTSMPGNLPGTSVTCVWESRTDWSCEYQFGVPSPPYQPTNPEQYSMYYGTGGSAPNPANPNPNVGVTTPPLITQIRPKVYNKPFSLVPTIPCSTIQKWLNIAKHQLSATMNQKVLSLSQTQQLGVMSGGGFVTSTYIAMALDINNAYSAVVNMDEFNVTINQLPYMNGVQMSPQNFLQYVRTNINSFVDTGLSTFTPYAHGSTFDAALWNSTNPEGAVISIDIPFNSGSVITSYAAADQWIFTTIKEPWNGNHPVSGNRSFGYTANPNGSYTFYVRGVDRLTDIWMSMAQGGYVKPFDKADALWTSFQNGLTSFVNSHAGNASVVPATKYRPDWSELKAVMKGEKPLSTLSNDCN